MFTTDQYQALQQRRLDIGFVRFNGLEPMADIAVVELQRTRCGW